MFQNIRDIFYDQCSYLIDGFMVLSDENKLSTVLCPSTAQLAKLTSRFIDTMMTNRKEIDEGVYVNTNYIFIPTDTS